MGHWKRLIKIPGDTDCYYYINIMTYLIHDSCLVVLVTVPDQLSAIMLHVYFVTLLHVTLSVVAYYSYTCILCIAYLLFSVYLADIITVYAQHRIMVILPMPICMFTSITSPLYNIIYCIKHETIVDITQG